MSQLGDIISEQIYTLQANLKAQKIVIDEYIAENKKLKEALKKVVHHMDWEECEESFDEKLFAEIEKLVNEELEKPAD